MISGENKKKWGGNWKFLGSNKKLKKKEKEEKEEMILVGEEMEKKTWSSWGMGSHNQNIL